MGKKTKQKQARVVGYLVYGSYRLFESFLRLLPMEIVCVIGSALGQLGYFLMPRRRGIVIRNLRIAYGDKLSLPEIRFLARKTFRHSGLNLIASIPASTLDNEELRQRVEVEGLDNLHEVLSQDKGCILLLAHMGNWEILTQLNIIVPEILPAASLYRPLNNPLLDRLVKRRRQSKGTTLYSRKDGFTKPISHLKSGGTLGCIADQHAGVQGVAVPLFGKTTSMTSLPALLHRKTASPILPVSVSTVGWGQWKISFHPQINITETEKKSIRLIAKRCAEAYKKIMDSSPADVLWMHGYWKVGRQFPLRIDGTQKKKTDTVDDPNEAGTTRKPFNMLVYLGDTPANQAERSGLMEQLKHYRPDAMLTIAGTSPEHPCADHTITASPDDPPHLLTNAIIQLDQSREIPYDCAFDLTDDSSGADILQNAGLNPIFARHGKFQNKNTRKALEQQKTLSFSQFLENLGLPEN